MASRDADRIAKRLKNVTERLVTELTLEITNDLIIETPVDLGWAQSNWVPSIGQPVTDTSGSPDAIDRGPQGRGMSEIVAFTLDMGDVFISNNVSYIEALNAGSSPKAPAGFVDDVVNRNVAAIEGKVFE